MSTMLDARVPARLWTGPDEPSEYIDERIWLEVERDEKNQHIFSLHTFDEEGNGSIITFQFDRESAIGLAAQILRSAVLEAG